MSNKEKRVLTMMAEGFEKGYPSGESGETEKQEDCFHGYSFRRKSQNAGHDEDVRYAGHGYGWLRR